MLQKRAFTIIGGDARIVRLANLLHAEGNSVIVHGIYNHSKLIAPSSTDLAQTIYEGNICILPLPMLDKDGNIHAPYTDEPIRIDTILNHMSKDKILLAGNIPTATQKQLSIHGIHAIDYFKREDLTVTNAMLTAEGAVQTLLNHYPDTLCNAKILILGFGRIGKFLAKLLSGFGCKITVAGRRPDTQAWIEALGLDYADIRAAESYSKAYEIIINTVPHPVLTAERINRLSESSLILDLASGEGGTDFVHAKNLGIQAIHALSLPGKTAPLAAGAAIKNAILNICNDLGV